MTASGPRPTPRKIGREPRCRLVFGWAALAREIFSAEQNLDDVSLRARRTSPSCAGDGRPAASANDSPQLGLGGASDAEETSRSWPRLTSRGEQSRWKRFRIPATCHDETAADDEGARASHRRFPLLFRRYPAAIVTGNAPCPPRPE